MIGLTLDTGAIVSLERGGKRATLLVREARAQARRITVPTPVVVEWRRGQRGPASRLLDRIEVEPLSVHLARIAGEALARVGHGPSVVDAVVVASAAQRGDIVLTGDLDDLGKLQAIFPSVRLLRV